jgi:hypothetical protein
MAASMITFWLPVAAVATVDTTASKPVIASLIDSTEVMSTRLTVTLLGNVAVDSFLVMAVTSKPALRRLLTTLEPRRPEP